MAGSPPGGEPGGGGTETLRREDSQLDCLFADGDAFARATNPSVSGQLAWPLDQ